MFATPVAVTEKVCLKVVTVVKTGIPIAATAMAMNVAATRTRVAMPSAVERSVLKMVRLNETIPAAVTAKAIFGFFADVAHAAS